MGWFEDARKRRQEYWRDWNAKYEAEQRKEKEHEEISKLLHEHKIRPDEIDGPDYNWDKVNIFLVQHGYHPHDTSYCTIEMDIINNERMDLCREQDEILKDMSNIHSARIAAKKELQYCKNCIEELQDAINGIASRHQRYIKKRNATLNRIHNGVD